jgi:hypothetical protein
MHVLVGMKVWWSVYAVLLIFATRVAANRIVPKAVISKGGMKESCIGGKVISPNSSSRHAAFAVQAGLDTTRLAVFKLQKRIMMPAYYMHTCLVFFINCECVGGLRAHFIYSLPSPLASLTCSKTCVKLLVNTGSKIGGCQSLYLKHLAPGSQSVDAPLLETFFVKFDKILPLHVL